MGRQSGQPIEGDIAGLDPFLLISALVQATGEADLLHEAMPYAMAPSRTPDTLPAPLRRRMADLAARAVEEPTNFTLSPDLLREMVNFAAGTEVPPDYLPMLLEESGVLPRAVDALGPLPQAPHSVAIVGAGVFSIALAVYLKRAGIPFTIYEKSDGLGGTWVDSRYPGCGVDTTSHLYVYSFALNPDWPRYFSKQREVLEYLGQVVDRFGLREHMRFGTAIEAARYDETASRWRLTARAKGQAEEIEANVLVSCVGQLSVPFTPDIPGLDSFAGPVLHTARWPADADLAGKRVAMIGAAASAVQLGPTIAPEVQSLTVFQRSPQWLSVRPNYHLPVGAGERRALREIPHFINWHRLGVLWQFGDRLYPALITEDGRPSPANDELRRMWEGHIRGKLEGRPDLLAKALPDFPPLTKRVPVDFGWLDMLRRDNVHLVTNRIARAEPGGLVTADGTLHAADAIVLATGYEATRMIQTLRIEGRAGRDLQAEWQGDDARAYLGMTVAGYPNLFIMYGPNSNLGHGGSLMFQGECQARYIATALRHMAGAGAAEIECRDEVFRAFNAELDRQMARTVWTTPGVTNWFKNSRGRVVNNWPWPLQGYWQRTRAFAPGDYAIR